jgi:hypothetical protein
MELQIIKQAKEKLKHEHRDTLVQIGVRAVEHALRFEPEAQVKKTVEQRLDSLRRNDLSSARTIIQEYDRKREQRSLVYSKETLLLGATVELFRIATSEKYISGNALDTIFIRCWDAGTFVDYPTEPQIEDTWQYKELRPLVEKAFQRLWDEERLLRKQKKLAA